MGKQRLRKAPPGRFKESPVTAEARRRPNLDVTAPSSLQKSQSTFNANIQSSFAGLVESPFDSGYFNEKILGFDMGPVDSSAFSPLNHRDPFNSRIDFEKIRADQQSTFVKLGNTGIQFLGKTSVGVVGNLVGGFYGLFKSVEEGSTTPMWDNEIYRTVDEWNESIEAKNTVFLNRKKGLGLNFELLKDVSDAFSFIAQAATSELIMQTLGNVAGGMGLATLPGRWARQIKVLNTLGRQLDNAQDLERLALNLGTTVEKLSRHKRNLDLMKATLQIPRRILTTTGYEASLEARQVADEFNQGMEKRVDDFLRLDTKMNDKEKEAYKKEFMLKANNNADKAGLATFYLNTAVLSASNMIQFPTLFGSTYFKAKKLNSVVNTGLGTIGKTTTTASKFTRGVSTMARVLKNPAVEFTEETMQKLMGESSKHYYESVLSTDTNGEVLAPLTQQWSDSLWHGFKEAYGTEEGLHEGIIGAIVGAIGLPGFKKVAGKSKLNWQGGIPGAIKDIRKKKHYTESTINQINSQKVSDAMHYKKDNAILATLDTDREDLAIAKGDKIEFDAVQDNKVFRYTIDRVRNGLDDHIEGDIAELQAMDLEKYKETFGEDSTFTQQDKDIAISNFADKVKIYSNAFKVAHKTLNVGNYQFDNITHSKLSDILTHTLATEKIYGKRLEEYKQALYDLNREDFTETEIDAFVKTAGKVKSAQQLIDDYISDKEKAMNAKDGQLPMFSTEEQQEALKDNLDEEWRSLLDIETSELQKQKEALKESKDLSEGVKNQIKNINKALALKEEYNVLKKFNANKSSIVRKQKKSLEELTNEINKKIKKQVSEAMKALGEMPKKITKKELEEYINLRPKLSEAINKKNDTDYILDRIEQRKLSDGTVINSTTLLQEIAAITERFVIATEVAASLYGVRRSPNQMYSKLLISDFRANLDNLHRKSITLHFYRLSNEPMSLMTTLVEELAGDLTTVKNKYKEVKDWLTPKSIEEVEETIKRAEETLNMFEDYVEEIKTKEKQDKDAQSEISDEPLDISAAVEGFTESKEDAETGDPINKNAKTVEKTINRLTLKEHLLDGSPLQSNPGYPTLEEALAKGKIKDKAAVTITFIEDEPDAYLTAMLEKAGVLDDYNEGQRQVEKKPSVLNKPTKEVQIFIRYAPIHINIYDKVADKVEGHYEFEIEDTDTIVYQQFLFQPNIDLLEDTEVFDEAVTELNKWQVTEKSKIKGKGYKAKTTTANIKAEYEHKYSKLEAQYVAFNRSITSNLEMRKTLLLNAFNGSNELKLKVHNVDQGNFESFKDGNKIVEEYLVEDLGIDSKNIEEDLVMYTNQYGKYVRLDGTPTDEIPNHPMQEMGTGNSSEIYIGKKDKSGRIVPIKMNITKLTPKEVDLILRVMEDYILAIDRKEFTVEIDSKDSKILANQGKLKIEEFLKFFLKPKRSGKAGSPIFLRNTYSLITKGIPGGGVKFQNYRDGVENVIMTFPPADPGINDDEILRIFNESKEALRETLLAQRHNINKDYFIKDGKLDRGNLKIAFEEGLINHSFNVTDNFDDIYDPNYTKRIVLSRADIDDVASDKLKPSTFAAAIKNLRGILINKEGDYETNLSELYYSIKKGIESSITIKLANKPDNITRAEKKEMLLASIDTIIQKKIDLILEVGERFPGKITLGIDHEASTKITKLDTALDQMLKTLYKFKNEVLIDKEYLNIVIKQMDHWKSLKKFLNEFKKPPAGNNFTMMNFVPNSDGTAVQNNIQSTDQLNAFIRMINVLDELTSNPGIGWIDVNYSETYAKADGRTFGWKYKESNPRLRVSNKKISNAHVKTRLKSVQIEEELVWKDGELIAGEIYFNFGTKNKDGKPGNQKVLVLSKNMPLNKNINIMTSLSLPFISPSTFIINEQFDSMLQDVQENAGEDLNARNSALGKFRQFKKVGKATVADYSLDEKEVEEPSSDDLNKYVAAAVKAEGLIEEDTNTPLQKPKAVLNKENLNTEMAKEVYQMHINIHAKRLAKNKTIKESNVIALKEKLKAMGVTNLNEYLLVLDYYNKENIMEANKQNIALGEVIFNEEKNDCE